MSGRPTAPNALAPFPVLMQRIANALLGPIHAATMLVIDRDTLLVQPANSLLREIPRTESIVNGLSGYPR